MPLMLAVLIFVVVASLGAALYTYLVERSRRQLVGRTSVATDHAGTSALFGGRALVDTREPILRRVLDALPESWAGDSKTENELVQAGYDSATAPMMFAAIRVTLLIGLPLMAALLAPRVSFVRLTMYVVGAAVFAVLLPKWFLVRSVRLRQTRIRRSLPDALDLLVVCIEAGISLDAAILRVAKDLGTVHPELASELLIVNRKTNAGMPREDALRGLWNRTGVNEVRTLVSHIVQGERWGTSSGRVLRVYAETLRRQRRQTAEKKAATLPVKMLLPLGLFIFPAIFIVILGPVAVHMAGIFKK